MDIRAPFSKLKKKVKRRLAGSKRNPDEPGAGVGEVGFDSTNSLMRQGPTGQSPQPDEPGRMLVDEGKNDEERREMDTDGGEVEQTRSHPHPDSEVRVGGGPTERKEVDGETVELADPSPLIILIPPGGQPHST